MSHTVTVTRTTTTTTTSAIIINTGYLKTTPGLLKILEVILAAVCLFLAVYFRDGVYLRAIVFNFFICVSTTALVASGCLLIACMISLSTASIIAKTIFELVYHSVMFALTIAASATLLSEIEYYSRNSRDYSKYMMASIIGFVLSILYLLSTVFAYRAYRGL